jgi:hypothetical protein
MTVVQYCPFSILLFWARNSGSGTWKPELVQLKAGGQFVPCGDGSFNIASSLDLTWVTTVERVSPRQTNPGGPFLPRVFVKRPGPPINTSIKVDWYTSPECAPFTFQYVPREFLDHSVVLRPSQVRHYRLMQ